MLQEMRSGLFIFCGWLIVTAHSFQRSAVLDTMKGKQVSSKVATTVLSRTTTTKLWNASPKRTARRDLQKRRRRNKPADGQAAVVDTKTRSSNMDEVFWKTSETRPLIKSEAREQGVDYWMDEEELRRYNDSLRRRPREVGQVPDEKLWKEVLSPYRENWIGLFSILIVVIATIVANFPELLQPPIISIPDL